MINTLMIAAGAAILYIIAYRFYGRFLGRKIFEIASGAKTPAHSLQDDIDFIPTKMSVLFGHHYTSIAGTGPIVGPAIAVIWGWLPALMWVLAGSIFMGAVHDFGALIISLRHQGKSISEISETLINKRVKILFFMIILFALWIVVAIFALIIAKVFILYPQTVIPVWFQIPVAVALGFLITRTRINQLALSLIAVGIMYATIYIGTQFPVSMPNLFGLDPTLTWMALLLVYAFIASVLPVWQLLQPRDYINSHELFIAMGLLTAGVIVARPVMTAPMIQSAPAGAPPMMPMLFVTVACGAISGFHSLVSSGTTSKQTNAETDALPIGFGGMLLEGFLAVLVILAIGGGLGMGLTVNGITLTGTAAFSHHYASWSAANGLAAKLSAFVTGAANILTPLNIPREMAVGIMGVLVAAFAATTLDTATRIKRYVISELAESVKLPFLSGRYISSFLAVALAAVLAFSSAKGTGAMRLWPLFGTTNQLIAGLALLVLTVYLKKTRKPVIITFLPMIFMMGMTGWAMAIKLRDFYMAINTGNNLLLFILGLIIAALEIWMVIETLLVLRPFALSNRQ